MATFTVWKFDRPDGADRAAGILEGAEQDGLVKIIDRALVSWPADAKRPRTEHKERHGAGWGAFWGMLFGALFLLPVVGAATGAAVMALNKAMSGLGITEEQLETIRAQVTAGTSALFVVTDEANLDRLGERFHGMGWVLVDTNLTEAERAQLVETFGGE